MNIKKTGRPSKVKTCPYREEIDDHITQGKSAYWISKWVTNEKEYPISESAIRRYIKNDFNIPKKGMEKYYSDKESEEKLDENSTSYSNDIHMIDNLLEKIIELLKLEDLTPGQLAQLIPQLLRVKNDLLKNDEGIIINIESQIGEENIFEYGPEEIEMIRNWGNQQDKEFVDKL